MRSIRTRLAVIFFLVTALSVAVIYVVVAPPLTAGLQHQRVNDLQALIGNKRLRHTIDTAYAGLQDFRDPATKKQTAAAQDAAEMLAKVTFSSQVTVVDVFTSQTGTQATQYSPVAGYPESGGEPLARGLRRQRAAGRNAGRHRRRPRRRRRRRSPRRQRGSVASSSTACR